MDLKYYLTGIATALLFGCNTQKGHNEKTEEVSKSIEAKTDEQRDLTIYVDLIEAFYGQKDYFIPLYSKDNYSEATSKIIERHQKERVFADDEITRTKLDEEIVTKFLSVENLDKLIVFGEDQNILDTLFRKNYEYYENMIESQYVATYEAKLPQNDFVVVSLNGLNRNHIQKSPVIHQDSIYLQKIIKDNFVKLLSTYAIVGERYEDDQSYLHDTLFWNTQEPYLYMRTTDDNRLLIGGEDEEFTDDEKRDGLINDKAGKLVKHLKKILPDYDFRLDFAWAGTFGETKDGLPYIGKHPDFPSTYFVLGFGGNGITFSVIGMDIIAAMMKNKKHPLTEYFKFRR